MRSASARCRRRQPRRQLRAPCRSLNQQPGKRGPPTCHFPRDACPFLHAGQAQRRRRATADRRTSRLTLQNKRKRTKRTNKRSTFGEGGCGEVTSSTTTRRDAAVLWFCYTRRATRGVLQPVRFSVSKLHLTQRKYLPSNSTPSGDGGTLCSRGSLHSRKQSSLRWCLRPQGEPWAAPGSWACFTLPVGSGSPGTGPVQPPPPGTAAGARRPGRARSPLQQPGRAAPGRAEQRVDPVPSAVSNNGKSPQITGGKRKKRTAHGAAKLPSALLPLGSSTEPLAYATLIYTVAETVWRLQHCISPSSTLGDGSRVGDGCGGCHGAAGTARQGRGLGPHQVQPLYSTTFFPSPPP